MLSANLLERRLQISGIIIVVGLIVEACTLLAHGAIAFLVFVGLGGSLLCIGIAKYLLALVPMGAHDK
jgi:hypothetical protein